MHASVCGCSSSNTRRCISSVWRRSGCAYDASAARAEPMTAPVRIMPWPVRAVPLAIAAVAGLAVVRALPDSAPRTLALFAVAVAIGAVLRGGGFSFTGAYRRLIARGDGREARAQLLMVAIATVLFAPALASGMAMGQPTAGAFAPLGLQVAAGALMFGVGMQLGGGCGSGTLNAVGGGSVRIAVTLAAFCGGSFWASLHMGWWQSLPGAGALVIGRSLDWSLAVALQLIALALLWRVLRWVEGHGAERGPAAAIPRRLLLAGTALAALNYLTLVLAGHPWTITWAFTLWGAKAAQWLGWDPAGHAFWSAGFTRHALDGPLLADTTSLMNVGIVIGALAVAGVTGRAHLADWRIAARGWLAALIGGVAMGYGARIAYGCNIGAFFSGAASTSLHGWLWIAAALPGNWVGVRLRPWFHLD